MKCNCSGKENHALTLIELVVSLAVVFVVFVVLMPALLPRRHYSHGPRIVCASNLKQLGLAFRIWQGDNGDHFPMDATNASGGLMFSNVSSPLVYFQAMSNELNNAKVLHCPADSKASWATDWTSDFHSSNISYFIGLDANDKLPNSLLSGDCNLTNRTKIVNCVVTVTTNSQVGWMGKRHDGSGNVLLSDGSVQQWSDSALKRGIVNTGFATNRLLMP